MATSQTNTARCGMRGSPPMFSIRANLLLCMAVVVVVLGLQAVFLPNEPLAVGNLSTQNGPCCEGSINARVQCDCTTKENHSAGLHALRANRPTSGWSWPAAGTPWLLRNEWQNRPLHTKMALSLQKALSNCTAPPHPYKMHKAGMGSVLHVWASTVLHVTVRGWLPVPEMPPNGSHFSWDPRSVCSEESLRVPLSCLFGAHLQPCVSGPSRAKVDKALSERPQKLKPSFHVSPPKYFGHNDVGMIGATELLFSNLSSVVLNFTRKQVESVFGPKGAPYPLVSVHMRWGDKIRTEALKVSAQRYVDAVAKLQRRHCLERLTVYIATEDKAALDAFRTLSDAAHPEWYIVSDPILTFNSSNNLPASEEGHGKRVADATEGEAALYNLASWLMALEAQYFVLTTSSNWSRIVNELRRAMLDVDCDGCTDLLDLNGWPESIEDLHAFQGK